MSQNPQSPGNNPLAPRERRQTATVRLNESGQSAAAELASMMDPATKSLADALRISYKLLLGSILVLVALYFGSGVQKVGESERGMRLLFGRVVSSNLSPGPQFSAPPPIGEIVKVRVDEQSTEVTFFPNLSEAEQKSLDERGPTTLSGGGSDSLDPNADGQLITADGSIAHARWSISYRRDDIRPEVSERNIDPDFINKLVVAVARRSIVIAAASMTLDEMMRNVPDAGRNPETFRTMEHRARELAQKALDDMDSGIRVQQLVMTQKFPPRRVMPDYYRVQSAESDAGAAVVESERAWQQSLQRTAGDAASVLVDQIDRYEVELLKGDDEAAAATFGVINKLLLGEPVEIDGAKLNPRVSGDVTSRLDQARQERTTMVASARSEAELFEAKLKAFNSNSLVLINSDWSDAYSTFLNRPGVQVMWLPPDNTGRLVMLINRDPMLAREQEMQRNTEQFQRAAQDRAKERERAQFEQRLGNTGSKMTQ